MNNYIGAHMASARSSLLRLKGKMTLEIKKYPETFFKPSGEGTGYIITSLFYRILSPVKITNLVESESGEIRTNPNPNLFMHGSERIRIRIGSRPNPRI